jgi:hypothetical protein
MNPAHCANVTDKKKGFLANRLSCLIRGRRQLAKFKITIFIHLIDSTKKTNLGVAILLVFDR